MSNLIKKARVIDILGMTKNAEQTAIVLDVIIEDEKVSATALLSLTEGWGTNMVRHLVNQVVEVFGLIKGLDGKFQSFEVLPLNNQSRRSRLIACMKRTATAEYYEWIDTLPIIDFPAFLGTASQQSVKLDEIFRLRIAKNLCPKEEWLDQEGEIYIYPTNEYLSEPDLEELKEYLERNESDDDYDDEPF